MLPEHRSCFIINNKCANAGTDFNFPKRCPHGTRITQSARTIPTHSPVPCPKGKPATAPSCTTGQQHNGPSRLSLTSRQVTYTADFYLLFEVQLHDAPDTFKYLCTDSYYKRRRGCISSAVWFRYCRRECFQRLKPWEQFYDLLSWICLEILS